MHENKDVIKSNNEKRQATDGKDKINGDTMNSTVGSTRKYVSGDEEKSSSSHQFHKS